MSTLQVIGCIIAAYGIIVIVLIVIVKFHIDKFRERIYGNNDYTWDDNFKRGSNMKISDSEALDTGGNFEDEVNDL